MEMILTANMISASEAKDWGLVNYVVEQEELLPLCEKLANRMAKNSSVAIAAAIKAINANYANLVNGFGVEIEQFGLIFGTDDFKEGTTAFLEKRKPDFE
jgi:enoyl-CoA hydratase